MGNNSPAQARLYHIKKLKYRSLNFPIMEFRIRSPKHGIYKLKVLNPISLQEVFTFADKFEEDKNEISSIFDILVR